MGFSRKSRAMPPGPGLFDGLIGEREQRRYTWMPTARAACRLVMSWNVTACLRSLILPDDRQIAPKGQGRIGAEEIGKRTLMISAATRMAFISRMVQIFALSGRPG